LSSVMVMLPVVYPKELIGKPPGQIT